jgi:Spy/CpxP family protein refolding chaperone
MTKAKLALVALALSCVITSPAARAAEDSTTPSSTDSVIQDTHVEPGVNADTPSNAPPLANLAQEAIGNMMELGDILTGDMPPPPGRPMPTPMLNQRLEARMALGASDGAPSLEGHMGMGGPGMSAPGMATGGPGMSHPGMAMGGCPMIRAHHLCPLAMLDGPNALSDDQYQKLYDIKGQFIATIVPKGLNMYVLIHKMQDLLTASDTDTKAVKDLEKQISSAASDLSMTVMDSIVSVDQVLTPEQRRELHRRMIRSTFGGGGQRQHHNEAPHPEK